jgi:hypothetical protein
MRIRRVLKSMPWLMLFASIACDASGPLVYTAQPYSPEGGCVGDYVPVGVVQGTSLSGACPPACLTINGQLYVSTACPPFPSEAVAASDSPDCPAALGAVASGLSCDQTTAAEGGSDDGGVPDVWIDP